MATGNTFNKFPKIPRPFGLPKEVEVPTPSSNESNIWIIAIDDRDEEIYKLRLQTVPLEVNVKAEANWAIIPAISRNNPFYHYTGGEDIVEFTIDWYSIEELREDVIRKCRWVESLSRADAYRQEPRRVILIFGELFKYTKWIVTAAPYRLSLFDKEKGMLPRQAYQDLTLRKVTRDNTTILDRSAIN